MNYSQCLRDGLNSVGAIQLFDGSCPQREIEVAVVAQIDRFGVYIDVNVLNGGKFLADIFDENGTGLTVNAGDLNESTHRRVRG